MTGCALPCSVYQGRFVNGNDSGRLPCYSILRLRTSPRLIEVFKRPELTYARIKCSSIGEKYDNDENGKESNDVTLLPNTALGGLDNLIQCTKEWSLPSVPLQLVVDTIRSIPFTFSVGLLLLLDFSMLFKPHHGLVKAFPIRAHETSTGSYTFLFLVSALATVLLGCICIPFLKNLKAYQVLRKEGPSTHVSKVGTPTMGGLYFISVGVIIAVVVARISSVEINGLVAATLLFGGIGLLDDVLSIVRKHNYGLPGWCKLCLQVTAGVSFCYWHSTFLSTPLCMKTVVLFPPPLPNWDLGRWYLPLTVFCFASMSNGVNLTDGLDGLAAGTAAAAFLGMTLAVQHQYPALAIFGVSMAGACVGFLVHNHHKAAVFMGDTGSMAIGGALAAMAASTGMFLPLLICSGIFFVEIVSVIIQVSYKKYTKKTTGVTKRLFRMAPIHHHFELGGVEEPTIVFVAHVLSCLFGLLGGYVGLKCCLAS